MFSAMKSPAPVTALYSHCAGFVEEWITPLLIQYQCDDAEVFQWLTARCIGEEWALICYSCRLGVIIKEQQDGDRSCF
jgi:hypothetical protein